jgi:hypothetical protein
MVFYSREVILVKTRMKVSGRITVRLVAEEWWRRCRTSDGAAGSGRNTAAAGMHSKLAARLVSFAAAVAAEASEGEHQQ